MKSAEIVFKNEMLWIGNLGQSLVILTFVCSLLAFMFYTLGVNSQKEEWKTWGRKLFIGQFLGVISIFITLFAIIFMHRYEYAYAQKHSSDSLPLKYMISCFWEGQEGSFLLWMFWNAFIGFILLRKKDEWEAPVLAVMALIQVMLSSMILGIDLEPIFGSNFKLGSSPFELFRTAHPEIFDIPVFANMDKGEYLKIYKTGTGLNPILQNPWMVIHPPTLFFGFAAAAVPFAYSIAGLWTGKLRAWVNPALIWSLICVGVLGTGIIMGGWWAYESLSFGGYWAWDPVENASLLPWLIMASAAHLLIISKNTGRHLFTSHFLAQLSFILVLYATFLTRSGVLGDASVHSFTDLGLSGQLLLFLFLFIGVCIVFSVAKPQLRKYSLYGFLALLLAFIVWGSIAANFSTIKIVGSVVFVLALAYWIVQLYKTAFVKNEEEKWLSRELWMFIGSLFLILSLVQIFAGTSSPVFSKIFNSSFTVNKADHYNTWQLYLVMPILFIMAYGQWLKWRDTDFKTIRIKAITILVISLALCIVLALLWNITSVKYVVFLLLSIMVVVGNFLYLNFKKYKTFLQHGSSIAHAGLGVLLIGVLVSSINKTVITRTEQGINMAPERDEKGNLIVENIENNRSNLLISLNKQIKNGPYGFEYKGNFRGGVDSISKFYNILFTEFNKDNTVKDTYTLTPEIQDNPKFGKAANPATKHYLHKDVFTHVSFDNGDAAEEPYSNFKLDTVELFERFLSSSGKIKLFADSIYKRETADGLELMFRIRGLRDDASESLNCGLKISETGLMNVPASSDALGVMIEPLYFFPPKDDNSTDKKNAGKLVLKIGEKAPNSKFVVIKAIEFPWINLVWGGTIIMVIGFVIAVRNRIIQQRNLQS